MDFLYDYFLFNLDPAYVIRKFGFWWQGAPALGLILLLEIGFNGWKESTLGMIFRPRRTDWWDIFSFFAFILNVRRFLSNLLVVGLVTVLVLVAKKCSLDFFKDWPLIATIPLAFVLQDFLLYWSHRFKHTNKMLWWVHEFHHSSTRVTVATSFRIHPLDYVVSFILVYAPMEILFGWEVLDYLVFLLVVEFSGQFNHSRLDTNLGWLGKWLLVSPRYHFHHHANDSRVINTNFGETLRIWDLLFGTDAGECQSIKDVKTGLTDNPYEEGGIGRALVHATYEFYMVPIRTVSRFFSRANRFKA